MDYLSASKNFYSLIVPIIRFLGSKSNLLRKRKRNVGEEIQEALKNKRYLMGNATLTKLWNVCPDNFEAAAGE